jgi:hypothetical protein
MRRFKRPFQEIRNRLMFPVWMRGYTPVLVYQMGKVGSSSIGKSLDDTYPGISVNAHDFFHGHHNWLVRRLYRAVMEEGAPLDIVSSIREPIGRNVSAFFENYERDTGVEYRDSNLSVQELRDLFLANYRHDLPLSWFEDHIESKFGIDVYASPFPQSGHATYASGRFRLLIVKVEIPDAEKERAIGEFLQLGSFDLIRANVGDQKMYADQYRAFKREVRLPSDLVDRICASRYFTHFYSPATIEKVRRSWSADTTAPGGSSARF